jgi:hypothetical protein
VDLQEPAFHAHVEILVETGETPLAHVAERSDVVGEHRYRQYGLSIPGHRRKTSSSTIWWIYQFEASGGAKFHHTRVCFPQERV